MFCLCRRSLLLAIILATSLGLLLLALGALAAIVLSADDDWRPAWTEVLSKPAASVAPDEPAGTLAYLFTSFTTADSPYFAEASFSQGSAYVENGSYIIRVRRPETRIKSAISVQHTSYMIETRVAIESASPINYAGVMVRALDNDGSYGVSFEVAANGTWRVTTDPPFSETEIIQPWTDAPMAAHSAAVTISARVAGRSIEFALDGQPVFAYDEVQSVGSYVALIAGTAPDGSNMAAHFHYVRAGTNAEIEEHE